MAVSFQCMTKFTTNKKKIKKKIKSDAYFFGPERLQHVEFNEPVTILNIVNFPSGVKLYIKMHLYA